MMTVTPVLSYAGYYGLTFERFMEEAHRLGYRAVELIPDQTPNLLGELTAERRSGLASLSRELGIVPYVHSIFYDLNPVSVVPEVRDHSMAVIRRCAELCLELGGHTITAHPGYQFPGWSSSDWQASVFLDAVGKAREALSDLADSLPVNLFLENGSYFLTTKESDHRRPLHYGVAIDELERLLAGASPRVGLCLDIGKAAASKLDPAAMIRSADGHPIRFQVGSVDGWDEAMAVGLELGVFQGPSQITYEGPRAGAEQFLDYARLCWNTARPQG